MSYRDDMSAQNSRTPAMNDTMEAASPLFCDRRRLADTCYPN